MRFYVPACALEYRPKFFFASQITHVCDPSHAQPYHTCTYLASDGIPRLRMNPKDRSLNSTAYRLQILLMPMRLLEPTGIYARPPRFTLPLFSFLGAHFFDPDDLTALFYHPHSTFQKPSVFAHCFSHDNRLSDLKSLQARRQWVFPLGEMRDFEKSFRLVEEVPVNPPQQPCLKLDDRHGILHVGIAKEGYSHGGKADTFLIRILPVSLVFHRSSSSRP